MVRTRITYAFIHRSSPQQSNSEPDNKRAKEVKLLLNNANQVAHRHLSSTRLSQAPYMDDEREFKRPTVSKWPESARRNQIVNFSELP